MNRQWPPRPHELPAVFKPGNETVGLLKSVSHRPSTFFAERMADPKRLFEVSHCFEFDASFYVANHVLTSPGKKVRSAVIMLNGLNEIHHYHFGHYDRLGAALAHRRLGGVLHPTPFHLNRSAYLLRSRWDEYVAKGGTQEWPKAPGTPDMKRHPARDLIRRPIALAQCFEQVSKEVVAMAHTLKRRSGREESRFDEAFYGSLFEADCDVTLLGYSMGGLQALYTFLRSPALFHRCILINSGVTIDDLNPKPIGISSEDWSTMAARAKRDFRHATEISDRALLRSVLFGRGLENKLGRHARDVLFISGGADQVANASKVHDLASGDGLTVLEIAGLGHPLTSPVYDRYFPLIMNAIEEFVVEPREGNDSLSAEAVLTQLRRFKIGRRWWGEALRREGEANLQGPAWYLDPTDSLKPEVLDRITGPGDARFYDYYLMSKRYFADDAELLRALDRRF